MPVQPSRAGPPASAPASSSRIGEIHRIGEVAASSLDLRVVLGLILQDTTQAVNASAGMIVLRDPASGSLKLGAALGVSPEFVESFEQAPIRIGEGLTGTVAETGAPVFIPEASSDDPRVTRPVVRQERLNSYLSVPLTAGGELIGLMDVLTRPPHRLEEADVRFCAAVGRQVGLAIRHAQMFAEQQANGARLRKSNRRLESFLRVSHWTAAASGLPEVLQAIVDSATSAIEVASGAVYLRADHDTISLAATCPALPEGFPDDLRVASLCDHPHIAEVLATGRPIVIADTRTAELTPAEREVVRLRNLRANLYLPVLLAGDAVGVLILSSSDEGHTFDEDDISFLQGLANQAARVFDAVRNYDQATRHARQLEEEIAERRRAEEERDRAQAQLLQAQKMESVGRLAGGVAHDFNNMLSVILGHADMAIEQLAADDPLHASLEEIRKAAERSTDLTRQLLAFARKQTIVPRVLDLNVTVGGMLRMLKRLIGENIVLTWKPGHDLWPVKMDPAQIDQILANLSVNARDAIAGVGTVVIETANVVLGPEECSRLGGSLPGSYVLLSVSDDGCGMPPEPVARIFEPFFTTKDVGKGTGLGLATVYGAVEQNNGFVNVRSAPGQGTTFRIYLPRHAAALQESARGEPAAAEPGSETVLLVEDEPAILQMTVRMLEQLGYTVVAAGTPGEALRLAAQGPGTVDLLLTDVVMPEMSGRDLARQLVSLHPGLRCIFMSGYPAGAIARQGIVEEGVRFIQKPFTRHDLAAEIRRALGAAHPRRPVSPD